MNLQLSDAAVRQLKALIADKEQPTYFRITILGGGCSGFQYQFSLDTERTTDDHIFEKEGVAVVIDSASLQLTQGGLLDYIDDMAASMFVLKNPNATASCGCGNSFAL